MKNFLLILTSLILLSGCGASPYQPHGHGGGYSSTQLKSDVFRVSFRGNGFTSDERANDLALLRSAEVTKEYGFNYFALLQNENKTLHSSVTTPITSTTYISANTSVMPLTTYGTPVAYSAYTTGSARTVTSGGGTVHITKPKTINIIQCFKEEPEFSVIDASLIIRSLRTKYDL